MDDLISRQAVIDALKNERSDWNCDYNVPVDHCIDAIYSVPSAQPDVPDTNAGDIINRQVAIDAINDWWITVGDKRHPADVIKALPSAQPERLTDDDFETIRIHLSAFKERLCNQRRWEEAEEYQRIIDRFMRFASR